MGSGILKIVNIGLAFSGLQYIQSTCFQAIGDRIPSILLALCGQVTCFIPVAALMSRHFGLWGIWASFPMAAMLAPIVSSALTMRTLHKNSIQAMAI